MIGNVVNKRMDLNSEQPTTNVESAAAENSFISPVTDRLLAGWEIASVTISFLIAEWVVRPFGGSSKLIAAIPVIMAFIVMLVSHRARKETPREIGWRLDNFWAAMRLLMWPVGGAALLITVFGSYSAGFRSSKWLEWHWLLWLLLWGLVQQYSLQGFINRRFQLIFGRGYKSVFGVAAMFALLHLPNPFLALVTFVGGLVSATVYQRQPNLIALSISHALLSVLLVLALPNSILSGLRVGFRYFV